MSEQQIKNINKDALTNLQTTFFSTASGYITQLNLQEGDYVSEGGSIVKLAALSTLWVEAQVYATQLTQINNAKEVIVEIPDIPGKKFSGRISFQNPELNPATRINLIRMRDGKMAMVWVQTSQNKFKSVMVETGLESGDMIEIKSGFQQNDEVVTSGAYLLQSEYIFRKGASPMAGMDMEGMKM